MKQETLHDPASERAVLAGVFQFGNDAYLDIADIIEPDSFADNNSIIWKAFQKTLEDSESVDIASFLSAAQTMGLTDHFDNADERQYISSLKEYPIGLENVRKHAIKIRKLQMARDLRRRLRAANESMSDITGLETVDEILAIAEKPALDIATHLEVENKGPVLIGTEISETIDTLIENKGKAVGISTGCPRLDKAIGGGHRRKTVSLYAARMKVGKSFLADHFAMHAAYKLGVPVLMLDTEMSHQDHIIRLLAKMSQLESNDIEVGKFDRRALNKAESILQTLPYHYVSVAGKDFEEVLSICRRWMLKTVGFDENGVANDCLIVYDYFKLMAIEHLKNMQETQALGFQISDMHNFTVKYDCPVVSFVQTNRDGIDGNDTGVIGASDRLAQIATSICLFKTKTEEEMMEETGLGNRKMYHLAGRHGGGLDPGDYIHMNLDGARATITEIKTRNEALAEPQEDAGFEEDEDAT